MTNVHEVARRAGVSPTTVSHVINKTRRVRPATRERVLTAVRELRFLPSAAARSLTTKRTRAIGVMITDITNAVLAEVVRGILDVTDRYHYSLVLCITDEQPAKEDLYHRLLTQRRVDGIIAGATSHRSEQMELTRALGIPIVFIDRGFPDTDAPLLEYDNEGGALEAVSHLIGDGHRRIGILAGQASVATMAARQEGYRRALLGHGLTYAEELVRWSPISVESGRTETLALLALQPPPSAIFANNILLGLGLLEALRDRGLRCPEDVGVVVFGDHPWSGVVATPLAVVRQPTHELGQRAAELLMRIIRGEPPDIPHQVMPTGLIVRASCATTCASRYREAGVAAAALSALTPVPRGDGEGGGAHP